MFRLGRVFKRERAGNSLAQFHRLAIVYRPEAALRSSIPCRRS